MRFHASGQHDASQLGHVCGCTRSDSASMHGAYKSCKNAIVPQFLGREIRRWISIVARAS